MLAVVVASREMKEMNTLKYKDRRKEQRLVNQLIRRINRWLSDCLSPEITVRQTDRQFDVCDGIMYYKFTFSRGDISKRIWTQEDLLNEYLCGGLFDFIGLYAKDLRDKVDFRLLTLDGYEFMWDEFSYRSKFERWYRNESKRRKHSTSH